MPSGMPIQNKSFTAVAGEHASLQIGLANDSTFETFASPSPTTTPSFQIPGPIVAYPYTPGVDPTSSPPKPAANRIDFYWYGGAPAQKISATFGISGSYYVDPYTETGTVTVDGPGFVSMSANTNPVVITSPAPPAVPVLVFGYYPPTSKIPNGINMTMTGDGATNGGTGQIAEIQVVNDLEITNNGGAPSHQSGYDNCQVFADQTTPPPSVSGNAQGTTNSADDPAIGLPNSYRTVQVSESFTDFLTYKPAGGDSIRITMGKMNWSWAGTATNTAPTPGPSQTPRAGIWALSDATWTTKPVGAASTSLPTWNGPANNSTAVPCYIPY